MTLKSLRRILVALAIAGSTLVGATACEYWNNDNDNWNNDNNWDDNDNYNYDDNNDIF